MRQFFQADRALVRICALALLCVGFFLFHIWMRTLVFTTGYEVGHLRQERRDLESRVASLRVEKVRLMGPESLQKLVSRWKAQGKVFETPQPHQLIYMKSRQ